MPEIEMGSRRLESGDGFKWEWKGEGMDKTEREDSAHAREDFCPGREADAVSTLSHLGGRAASRGRHGGLHRRAWTCGGRRLATAGVEQAAALAGSGGARRVAHAVAHMDLGGTEAGAGTRGGRREGSCSRQEQLCAWAVTNLSIKGSRQLTDGTKHRRMMRLLGYGSPVHSPQSESHRARRTHAQATWDCDVHPPLTEKKRPKRRRRIPNPYRFHAALPSAACAGGENCGGDPQFQPRVTAACGCRGVLLEPLYD
uniref:Uncharacterized protein n=1 Tax=Oryza rufipogon TaxID=4529 RepID=A0A0E0MUG2_ORYRU